MKNLCQRLKTIKVISQHSDMNAEDKLSLIEEHTKYLRYCTKNTMEVENIISAVDSNDLSALEKYIDAYIEKYDESDMMYHYCSMEAFKGILNSKSLWLSESMFMNDKYEGRWIDKIVEEVILDLKDDYSEEQLAQYKRQFDALKDKKAYMCCFSKESDKLSQWRAYAGNASGVAIGFSRAAIRLTGNFDFELALMDVLYNKEEHIRIIKESIKFSLDNDYIGNDKELAYYFKNPSFYEEEEVRFLYTPENDMSQHTFADPLASKFYELMSNNISDIKQRNRDKEEIAYFEYDLTGTMKGFSSELIPKIVIGPRNRTDLKQIQELLIKQGLGDTEIVYSESSYI